MDLSTPTLLSDRVSKALLRRKCRILKKYISVCLYEPPPSLLRLVLWVFLLLPVSGSENTDVNCGGDCRTRALIMRCLHSDPRFLRRRLHSVVAGALVYDKTKCYAEASAEKPAGGQPACRT